MIDLWPHKQALQHIADDTLHAVRRSESRWLHTSPGGGRHRLFHQLTRSADVVGIELLGARHVDAPVHALVQLARALGEPAQAAPRVDGDQDILASLQRRAKQLAERAVRAGKSLVLLLPLDWPRGADWSQVGEDLTDEEQPAPLRRLRTLLQGIHDARAPVVVISSERAAHPWRRDATAVRVTPPVVGASDLRDDEVPHLRNAVNAVRVELDRVKRSASPIEARVLVGLAALGYSTREALGETEQRLYHRFANALAERPELARCARTLALARQPLRREALDMILPGPGAEREVLIECVAYGDQLLRVPEPVQFALLARRGAGDRDEDASHAALSRYHARFDGQASPRNASQEQAIAWLEKVYHLAHGGLQTEDDWRAQVKLDREQYWQRARHLSKVEQRYRDAASLYEECLRTFGSDSYTEHYLAYNLDRDRASPARVRPHYDNAVRLDPANPWWNARRITFLIGNGTLEEVRRAWAQALATIDPNGERMQESPWLALHLHRWVARRWLALGYVAEARRVIDEIPLRWLDEEASLREVVQLVSDAAESRDLGESVYPAGIPVEQRWIEPHVTPARNAAGAARQKWWPGRVEQLDGDDVVVVLADPETRTAYRVSYAADEWREMANQEPTDAHGFVELAEYADGSRQVRVVPEVPGATLTDADDVIARLAVR